MSPGRPAPGTPLPLASATGRRARTETRAELCMDSSPNWPRALGHLARVPPACLSCRCWLSCLPWVPMKETVGSVHPCYSVWKRPGGIAAQCLAGSERGKGGCIGISCATHPHPNWVSACLTIQHRVSVPALGFPCC